MTDVAVRNLRLPTLGRRSLVLGALAAAVVVVAVVSAGVGAYPIRPMDVLREILGIDTADPSAHAVLWNVRLPRVALGLIVGLSLGTAGAVLQGIFRNPLAEPGVVGVSSGAALGAVAAIFVGAAGTFAVSGAAFAGGLVATVVVYRLARRGNTTEVVTLVLTGIAVNAFAGAGIGLLSFLATDGELRAITFWSLGSLASSSWNDVVAAAPIAAVGLLALPRLVRPLDLFALGERQAGHLGVDLRRTRALAISSAALLTAGAVATAGIISFVGLVVPHLVRLALGPSHRMLLPASALGGALVIVSADVAARTVAAPAELPLGVLTALIGGPFFLWLVRRTRVEAGGFA